MQVKAVSINADGSYNIEASYKIRNIGGMTTPRDFAVGAYLSSSGVLDTSARLLLGAYKHTGAIAPGQAVDVSTVFRTAPNVGANADWPAVPAGTYTLHIKADAVGGSYYYANTGSTCASGGVCTLYSIIGVPGDMTSAGVIAEDNEANNSGNAPVALNP